MTPVQVEIMMRLDHAQEERDDHDAAIRALRERVQFLEDVLRKLIQDTTEARGTPAG